VDRIKPIAAKTHKPGVLGGIGGFGALFELPLEKFKNPILVSSTDGVGTKLKLAIEMNKHDTIGIDLVAMCVNDIIVQGAEPLFFLDYFATGKLEVMKGESLISGIAKGCQEANTALVGGETAEMPGVYSEQDYDLAGFVVGIVEKSKLITGADICQNDVLIALPSSGLHSNGYSLARKVLELKKYSLERPFGANTLGETLLTPTRIYVKTILDLLQKISIKAIAHITGGGIHENLPRVLPSYKQAIIQRTSWEWPEIFCWLSKEGNIADEEMLRTFNCGVGMILCVSHEHEQATLQILSDLGERPWKIGYILNSEQKSPMVSFNE
jgi:phosphoribosylformylglycinamidine cyclo-ligase